MIQLAPYDACTGCFACKAVCPHNAVEKHMDKHGFYYPLINKGKCKLCHRCEKVCPVFHPYSAPETLLCFAAYNSDEKIRSKSSSGGVFYTLAEQILAENGCVFGCTFDGPEHVIHRKAETIDELLPMQGSKYLQSDLQDTFYSVQKEVSSGRKVLFSGCPCQIAGLKHFLGDHENLITMEVICHGVPAPEVWRTYLTRLKEEKNLKKILNVCFRNKSFGWNNYHLLISAYAHTAKQEDPPTEFYENAAENPFMQAFLHDLSLRPSCYHCSARQGCSHADITAGDFWGIEKVLAEFGDNKGISAVLIHSENGKLLWQDCKEKLKIHQVSYLDIIACNSCYAHSVVKPRNRKYFMRKYHSYKNFSKLVQKASHRSWLLKRIKQKLIMAKQLLLFFIRAKEST